MSGAVEVLPGWRVAPAPALAASPWVTGGERLLREAVTGPDVDHVRASTVQAPLGRRIDVYRLRGEVADVAPRDLSFPSCTTRVFPAVRPIPTRP